ncbi:MAG: hypothetical protein COB67_10950 [SAR324 cluster bacterium]|uniref:Alpha-D-phosphohexomutase alpha/beta/alpha domain-containing protein n=1 Tax=SAR324 cluster bacterium TaxID=2024889 RepID=A0A2A4SVU9_9DELT|nr:MAG: hypothetical protein COB67_10950 [SAR324 cluster bacterium]
MVTIPQILQGTDGIRGRVRLQQENTSLTSLQYFLESGFLTPSFFEHYTYAYAALLLSTGMAELGDKIIVGWDPRDKDGIFNQAAMNGLRKAGLTVVQVGTLPTPAIPLYMIHQGAVGSVVLTASHNPSDQNGIKLFHGFTALKFLPRDDRQLTQIIEDQQTLNLEELPLAADLEDHSQVAKELFISFCCDGKNSWVEKENFNDTILVVDASKGAIGTVAQEIFSTFNFKEVIYTNLEGNINESCGVADLEGREVVTREEITTEGAPFQGYEALRALMDKVDEVPEIKAGGLKLIGLVFDGDGDRCYRLDYMPDEDEVLVSSGDFLGIHQARFLQSQGKTGTFINTVESDLNVAITAENMGFDAILTGVGDKWILLQALLDWLQCQVSSESELHKALLDAREGAQASGLMISKLWKEYQAIDQGKTPRFLLGLEESGHSITPGYLSTPRGTTLFFAGNGIKAGLNSLVAIRALNTSLRHPYEEGVKQTFYTYYVDKSRLQPGHALRQELTDFLSQEVEKVLPPEFNGKIVDFPEESSMLYCKIFQKEKLQGAIFIRNSGTEDKSALYLRGTRELEKYLEQLGTTLHTYLLRKLKNRDNEFAQFELKILEAIHHKTPVEAVAKSFPDLPFARVMKEIELKQHLIFRSQGSWSLTEKGQLFLEA